MIIDNRKLNPINMNVYAEKHHIVPRSLGGNNSKSNIIRLLPREHFICHLLLLKMTTGSDKVKMSYAIRMMSIVENNLQSRYKIGARLYEMIVRLTKPIIGFDKIGEKNSYYGKKHTEKTKEKMRAKRLLQFPPMLGKIHSDETRIKLRKATIKHFSEESNREMRRQRSLEQFKDPNNRYKAGNGKRGKKWYYDPVTYHTLLCFEQDKPLGYIPGRKLKHKT